MQRKHKFVALNILRRDLFTNSCSACWHFLNLLYIYEECRESCQFWNNSHFVKGHNLPKILLSYGLWQISIAINRHTINTNWNFKDLSLPQGEHGFLTSPRCQQTNSIDCNNSHCNILCGRLECFFSYPAQIGRINKLPSVMRSIPIIY